MNYVTTICPKCNKEIEEPYKFSEGAVEQLKILKDGTYVMYRAEMNQVILLGTPLHKKYLNPDNQHIVIDKKIGRIKTKVDHERTYHERNKNRLLYLKPETYPYEIEDIEVIVKEKINE